MDRYVRKMDSKMLITESRWWECGFVIVKLNFSEELKIVI